MLTIIIGLAIVFGLVWLEVYEYNDFKLETLTHIAIAVTLSAVIVIGCVCPINGYREPELIEEIELATFSNNTDSVDSDSLLYVKVSASNVYSYRYEVPNTSTVEGKMYKVATVSGNVTEMETNTDKPVLQIYEAKAKKSIWGLAIGMKKTSYVFVVPKGSISHSVVLN